MRLRLARNRQAVVIFARAAGHVKLLEFPPESLGCSPKISRLRYIVVEDDVVIVDPSDYSIVETFSLRHPWRAGAGYQGERDEWNERKPLFLRLVAAHASPLERLRPKSEGVVKTARVFRAATCRHRDSAAHGLLVYRQANSCRRATTVGSNAPHHPERGSSTATDGSKASSHAEGLVWSGSTTAGRSQLLLFRILSVLPQIPAMLVINWAWLLGAISSRAGYSSVKPSAFLSARCSTTGTTGFPTNSMGS